MWGGLQAANLSTNPLFNLNLTFSIRPHGTKPMFVEQDPLPRLPQAWESFGFFLPRSLLNRWEISRLPDPVPEAVWNEVVAFWAGRKVALVKQTAYQGLYPESSSGAWIPTVLRSGYHLGPFSFLADLGADY